MSAFGLCCNKAEVSAKVSFGVIVKTCIFMGV